MSTYYYFYIKKNGVFTCIAEVNRNDSRFDPTTYISDNCWNTVKPLTQDDLLWYADFCKEKYETTKINFEKAEKKFNKYMEIVQTAAYSLEEIKEEIYGYMDEKEESIDYLKDLERQKNFSENLISIMEIYRFPGVDIDNLIYIGCETGVNYNGEATK